MSQNNMIQSKHFVLQPLDVGVYACIHRSGGAAFSNAGIVDLGERTVLVDAFDSSVAGRDLRQTAESLFGRPVDTIVFTHAHGDHWKGASAFDANTTLLGTETTGRVWRESAAAMMEDFQDPVAWEEEVERAQERLKTEQDERVRAGLEKSVARMRYTIAEMSEFQPRFLDQTFEDTVTFEGRKRNAELRSLGRGHSQDDVVLLLPDEGIAFIGDVGFFAVQPFMGACDLDLYREQLRFFQDSDFHVLVPGHGPVGGRDEIALQLRYFDVVEGLVGEVVQRGGSLQDALQIALPAPFDQWLVGGMARFEANVRYLFARAGGEVPEAM
jgi:cyclase